MSWILALTIGVTFAIVCAQMARTRKRDVVVWTALGFVTGIFGVIALAMLGNAENREVSVASGENRPQSEYGRGGILSVRDVSVVFGGIVALNGVSFDMKEGQILGLIGPNGAGKTTLFNCLSRLYQPSKGEILMEGRSILTRQPSQIADVGIGRTFQNVALFSRLTVRDNIRIGGHSRSKSDFISDALKLPWVRREEQALNEKVDEILTYLDLHSVADRDVAGLPFGTQKRVELGRALAAEPKILLLDEPAGGLNHEEVHGLGDLIRRIRDERKMTVLLVEHHMGLVMSIADHVVALNFGKKLAEGTPAAVQSDPDVIKAYLGSKDS